MACSPACVAPLLSGQTKSGTDAWPDFGPTIAGNGPQCDEWIDNRLHYVRDVSFGEDASQIRSGAAPQVMAALRNAVLRLLRDAGWSNIAAAVRYNAWRPGAALQLLGLTPI